MPVRINHCMNAVCILFFPQNGFSLNTIVGNGKRFIAYEITKRLQQQNHVEILQQLSEAVSDKRKTKGQLHKVFEDSFDAKSIETEKFFYQKPGPRDRRSVFSKYLWIILRL